MRKISLIALIILMILPVFPAQAQEEVAACSEEEFVGGTTIVADSFETVETLIETSDEPGASELTTATMLLDSFTIGYWDGFLNASDEGLCAEIDWLGYTGGLVLDEMLITSQLSALALHEVDAGNDDLAVELSELAVARAESLEASVEAIDGILGMLEEGEITLNLDFAECTQEELDATYEGLDEIAEVYEAIGILSDYAEDEEYSVLIVAYATLSAEYWADFMPEVPACYEAQDEAYFAGLIIDESLIVVSGYRLAELEAETGDEEVAGVLEENADERFDSLLEALEDYE